MQQLRASIHVYSHWLGLEVRWTSKMWMVAHLSTRQQHRTWRESKSCLYWFVFCAFLMELKTVCVSLWPSGRSALLLTHFGKTVCLDWNVTWDYEVFWPVRATVFLCLPCHIFPKLEIILGIFAEFVLIMWTFEESGKWRILYNKEYSGLYSQYCWSLEIKEVMMGCPWT